MKLYKKQASIAISICCIFVAHAVCHQIASAQKKDQQPAKPTHVLSIHFGQSSGMCYGYCKTELEVKPGDVTLLESAWDHRERYPDLTVRSDLSDKHWRELQMLVDHDALLALPDRLGCPGCVDEVIEGITVRFSDKTTKSILYNAGDAPQQIKALSEKLNALYAKLRNEIPPHYWSGKR